MDRLLFARAAPTVHTGDGPPPFAVVSYGLVVAGLEYRNYRALHALERTQELVDRYNQLLVQILDQTEATLAQTQATTNLALSLANALLVSSKPSDPNETSLYSPSEFEFFNFSAESYLLLSFFAVAIVLFLFWFFFLELVCFSRRAFFDAANLDLIYLGKIYTTGRHLVLT